MRKPFRKLDNNEPSCDVYHSTNHADRSEKTALDTDDFDLIADIEFVFTHSFTS